MQMSFEDDLDRLAKIIRKSRSKELKNSFVAFLNSFNSAMRNYYGFLQFFSQIQQPQEERWDVTLVQQREN